MTKLYIWKHRKSGMWHVTKFPNPTLERGGPLSMFIDVFRGDYLSCLMYVRNKVDMA